MPLDSAPGQVLSSMPPSSEKRRSSKIGGCAGVLFQIFHGRRLFPRKTLPAERPKHGPINHTDDKLPIAKLLLIADENRVGPLTDTEDVLEGGNQEDVLKEDPWEEEKVAKRTPSVVARLMGLDSMPSLEPAFVETKQFEPQRKDMDCQFSFDEPQERPAPLEKPRKSSARVQPHTSVPMARRTESKASLPEKLTTQQKSSIWKDKAKDDVAKSKNVTKNPSLPPHHVDSSFPSAVCSSKKEDTINRSSMRMQKPARLLEAAARMLEASTPRTNQSRKQRLQNSSSRNKTSPLDASRIQKGQSGREQVCVGPRSQANQQLTTTAVQAPSNRREETKVPIGSRNTNSEMISRRQNGINASVPESGRQQAGLVGPEQALGGGRGTQRETAPVKGKQGYQQSSIQPRANSSEKVKPDWRRQEETNRRLSQPTSFNEKFQKLKLLGSTHTRHPSPPKSYQDSCSGPCSSQASNSTVPASEGIRSSQPTQSRVSSNITPPKRLSSLSAKGEVMQPLQSVYSKGAGLPDESLSESRNPSTSVPFQFGEADNSLYSQNGSISSAIYTESHRRSSMESLLSSDPSLSELTSSSEDCSSFPIGTDVSGHERDEGMWQGDNSSLSEPKRASDLFLSEDSSLSKLESLSTELGDTASSLTLSDADSRGRTSVHTYSGKNTAAILQELLTALSPSTTSDKTFRKPGVECTDLQDSASCHSLDSSVILESNKFSESNSFLESMDCTSIAETQAGEVVSRNRDDMAQIQVDHGVSISHTDFADCEALMSTLSKLHRIDPEAIGLNVRAAKHHMWEDILPIGGMLSDAKLYDKLAEQPQQLDSGLSNYASLSAEDDTDSLYRSDMESSFRNGYEDAAAAQNKKLVTDCINEAFNSLSKQLCGVSSSISGHSSAGEVLSRVYKQIDEWKGMAINMNLDDMIEKEMNTTTRRWRNIGTEADEVVEVVESTILSGLMEEVLLELL